MCFYHSKNILDKACLLFANTGGSFPPSTRLHFTTLERYRALAVGTSN